MERRGGNINSGDIPVFASNPVKTYPLHFTAVVVLGFLASIFEGIGIGLLIPLLALSLSGALPPEIPGPVEFLAGLTAGYDTDGRVLMIGSFVLLLIVVKGVVQGANIALIGVFQGKLVRDLRTALGRKVLDLDYPFYLAHERSRMLPILMSDCWYASESIRYFLTMVPAGLSLFVFGVLLIVISVPLGLIALFGALLIQTILIIVERRQRRLSALVVPLDHEYGERTIEIVSATRVIRLFGRHEREAGAHSDTVERLRKSLLPIDRTTAMINPISDVLIACTFVAILLISPRLGSSLPVTTGFLILLARAQAPVQILSRARIQIASHSAAHEQVRWLLRQQPLPASVRAGKSVAAIDQSIRFENVSFSYPQGTKALSDATFTLRNGKCTALIGRSGAGKTSLVNLLAALVQPSSGEIWHGEDRLSDLSPVDWRARIAVAGQDIDLLEGTIADNVAYGRADATREDIAQAIDAVGAADFISQLPHGIDTHLGFNAPRLSGGQRQRISLARALCRRPDLLILDEAISAVDGPSASEIVELLGRKTFFRTALFISHRRSALAGCEEGIVIEKGRIVEWGPLTSLDYYQTTR